jgi:hypothetical protein
MAIEAYSSLTSLSTLPIVWGICKCGWCVLCVFLGGAQMQYQKQHNVDHDTLGAISRLVFCPLVWIIGKPKNKCWAIYHSGLWCISSHLALISLLWTGLVGQGQRIFLTLFTNVSLFVETFVMHTPTHLLLDVLQHPSSCLFYVAFHHPSHRCWRGMGIWFNYLHFLQKEHLIVSNKAIQAWDA